jgi:DNA-binding transcriptional MerR regulator
MDSNDVRFPWEDPENPPAAPAADDRGATDGGPALSGAAHTEEAGAARVQPADEPWAADPDAGAADDEPWAATPAQQAGAPAQGTEGAPAREKPIAPREYYSISEVCDLVDLKPHVLRYWETQFAVLNPSKNRSGNRVYQRKEIKLIQLVKNLLYDEKYTVEGAKQKLEQLRRGGDLPAATSRALDAQTVDMVRTELRRLAELLTVPDPA